MNAGYWTFRYPWTIWFTCQGSLGIFVIFCFWFANRQEKIDEEFGFNERGGSIMIKGKFIDNLPKVYGIYTGGFIGFIILMAIGEQDGYDC